MANEPNRVNIPCRICYVKLAEPVLNDMSKKYEYSVECRIPKDDKDALKKIRAAMKKACIEKFGENPSKWPSDFREKDFFETHLSKNGKDGFFLRDGDKKDAEDYQGQAFFTARSSAKAGKTNPAQPTCGKILQGGKQWAKLTGSRIEDELYSGCYANVLVDIVAYDVEGSKGVGAYLKAVMKTADGERLSGSAPVDMSEYGLTEVEDEEIQAGEDDLDV